MDVFRRLSFRKAKDPENEVESPEEEPGKITRSLSFSSGQSQKQKSSFVEESEGEKKRNEYNIGRTFSFDRKDGEKRMGKLKIVTSETEINKTRKSSSSSQVEGQDGQYHPELSTIPDSPLQIGPPQNSVGKDQNSNEGDLNSQKDNLKNSIPFPPLPSNSSSQSNIYQERVQVSPRSTGNSPNSSPKLDRKSFSSTNSNSNSPPSQRKNTSSPNKKSSFNKIERRQSSPLSIITGDSFRSNEYSPRRARDSPRDFQETKSPHSPRSPISPEPKSPHRRLSLRGFTNFKRPNKFDKRKGQENDEGGDSSRKGGFINPTETRGEQEKFMRRRGGKPNHQSSQKKKTPDESIDKAFGIYRTVLNNAQISQSPRLLPELNQSPRARSRSGDHFSSYPLRQPELLVTRPTGKLRQTLLKPFTVFNSSKLASMKNKYPTQDNLSDEQSNQTEENKQDSKILEDDTQNQNQSETKSDLDTTEEINNISNNEEINIIQESKRIENLNNDENLQAIENLSLQEQQIQIQSQDQTETETEIEIKQNQIQIQIQTQTQTQIEVQNQSQNEISPQLSPKSQSSKINQSQKSQKSQKQKQKIPQNQQKQNQNETSSQSKKSKQQQRASQEMLNKELKSGEEVAQANQNSIEEDNKEVDQKEKKKDILDISDDRELFQWNTHGKVFDLKRVLNFVEPGGLPNLTAMGSLPQISEGKEIEFRPLQSGNESKKRDPRRKEKRNIRSAPEIKVTPDYIRTGTLFMLVPLISQDWNVYYCALSITKLMVYETEAAIKSPPLFSLLVTEINEIDREAIKNTTESVCTIFSHSVLVIKFMAGAKNVRDWVLDIEASRVESLRIVCSTATLRVGHSRTTSFEDSYNISGDRGVGGYSFVKEAIDRTSGKQVIVKFINKSMVKNGDDGIPSEIDILLKMKHANIVEIEEVFESEDYFIYVMEKFGKGTDLFDFLQEQERLSEGEARYIFRQVLSAVAHLASQNVVHGDIKDENIIINQETQQIKLIDFGSNKKFLSSSEEFTDFQGTKHMACPEVINHQPFNPLRQEIWSLGVLLFILLTGEIPFETEEDILEGALPEELRYQLSDECRDLLCMMLETNPKYQASLSDIVNHDWLKKEDIIPFKRNKEKGDDSAQESCDDQQSSSQECLTTSQQIEDPLIQNQTRPQLQIGTKEQFENRIQF